MLFHALLAQHNHISLRAGKSNTFSPAIPWFAVNKVKI